MLEGDRRGKGMNQMAPLAQWAKERGMGLTRVQLDMFAQYKALLLEWNTRINLTAITDDEGIWQKHFADSLTLLPLLPAGGGQTLIDIGTGAGFPGIPLKIARPDINIVLMDSLRKRVLFLRDAVEKLNLDGIECIHARAEEAARLDAHRGLYDVCTARAVARLDVLVGYCLPFVKPGGSFLAMKGPDAADEVERAGAAIKKAGGIFIGTTIVEIVPGLRHSVVVIKRTPLRS
jgi:16S rRNA (guanine527-N7)-methyltransferase